jgi:hypothetical protein
MEPIELSKGPTDKSFASTTVKWEIADGIMRPLPVVQKCVCALRVALKEHLDRTQKGVAAGTVNPSARNQYFLEGKEIYIESCVDTKVGDQTSYKATGRAELGQINMAADTFSTEVVSFDITFRDDKDEMGLPSVTLVSGSINVLPRGSTVRA